MKQCYVKAMLITSEDLEHIIDRSELPQSKLCERESTTQKYLLRIIFIGNHLHQVSSDPAGTLLQDKYLPALASKMVDALPGSTAFELDVINLARDNLNAANHC